MDRIGYSASAFASLLSAFMLLSASVSEAQSIPDDFSISLERTSCFGDCPVYRVTIEANGQVTYEGVAHVRVKDRQTRRIPLGRVVSLVAAVATSGFYDLQDRYVVIKRPDGSESWVTDLPTTYVTVTSKGRTKKVTDYLGAPPALEALEKQVDEAAETKQWIRITGQAVLDLARDGWLPSREEGAELLRLALEFDDVDAIAALVTIGVDPNTLYFANNTTPLMQVRSAGAVRALLAAGADPALTNDSNHTALWNAADLAADVTEALLKGGARADQVVDSIGHTALFYAASVGNIGVVKLLVAAGGISDAASALQCARDRRPRGDDEPLNYRPPYLRDHDAVIALLEQATAKRRR